MNTQTDSRQLRYFIYTRKSSEPEDKQMLSLPAQISELTKLAKDSGLTVVGVFQESRSAHTIGRPYFNEMMTRIEAGEANGILVWDESRIARNSYDGGKVVYMMDLEQIVEIRKPGKTYKNTPDDKSWLQMCFMMSKKESDDKSNNVKRGLREKAKRGMYVGSAKPGYMFDPLAKQGEKDLIPIPGKHELIEKAWRTMLSGKYRVSQVLGLLNDSWGYRTPVRGKLGGKPMHLSEIYEMFHDPFYYSRFEYPKGSDTWHKWRGQPMITEEEFMRVQILIGNKFMPKPQHRVFAFTGLMRCGECDSSITAEEKWQVICTKCRLKFSSLNRNACPNCNTLIANMDNPTILHYIYYHCSKKKNRYCTQGSITVDKLEAQIDEVLKKIGISEEFKEWAIKYLNELNDKEVEDRNVAVNSLQNAYQNCVKRLDNLVKLKISPQNSDGSLLSDEEFKSQKEAIVAEKRKIETSLGSTGKRIEDWLDTAERTFDFAIHARYRFANGALDDKREILSTIGSNLIFKDKKIQFDLQKPYFFLQKVVSVEPTVSLEFEPEKRRDMKAQLEASWAQNPFMQGCQDSNLEKQFWRLL